MNSNLDKEIKEYSDFNKQIIVTISKFSQFFKNFGQQGKKFIKSASKSLDEFNDELKKENHSSTIFTTYNYFVLNIKDFLKAMEDSFDNIDKKLGESIDQYETQFKNMYGEAINEFNDLYNVISEKKEKIEKIKYTYFESCKSSLDYENKMKQTLEEQEINKLKDQYTKSLKNVDYNEDLYKSEIRKMNKLYEDNEETYTKVIKKFRDLNINKIHFFSKILKDIFEEISQFTLKQKDPISNLDKTNEAVKVNRDIILYDEKFNYYNDNRKGFLLEQFLDFKKFIKTLSIETPNVNNPENNTSTIGNWFGFLGKTTVIEQNNNNNNKESKAKNPDELLKRDIIDKVLKLGKNDSKFIEKDDEAKANYLFLKALLFQKEKLNDVNTKAIISKIETKEQILIRFMSVLITFYK